MAPEPDHAQTDQPAAEDRTPTASDFAAVCDWPGYYRAVRGKEPRSTLVEAIDRFDHEPTDGPRLAIDLGCGEGRDTLELLARGWQVLAIDAHPEAFEGALRRVAPNDRARLECRLCSFAEVALPRADLVNASFSLPFCEPDDFPGLWDRIVCAIRSGGRFSGQLFGDRDSWAALPGRSHQSEADARDLFGGFELERFEAEEADGHDVFGRPKHRHMFHIVARKR